MNYCDDCILLDICGKEGCLDDAMTFCADKDKFIPKSVAEDIKDDIARRISKVGYDTGKGLAMAMCIINDHIRKEQE